MRLSFVICSFSYFSVNIREWLWQRPYTTLELQHVSGNTLKAMSDTDIGVDCIEITITDDGIRENLASAGYTIIPKDEKSYQVFDPDGARITLIKV